MLKKYERNLKLIQSQLDKECVNVFHSSVFQFTRQEIMFLAAKGLINAQQYANGDPNFKISLTPLGITYFSDKKERINRYILDALISLLVSLLVAFFCG